ncbi:GntR family transcriptional regulator [Actinomadura kijaniata]|uniref:DNA-binding GntR family transcriptional regulator n=1 Tax=Actinomadura namibiensis TaxID=182080 RepID=A0A7W3LPP4_ACTNM|nr:GntR family transcriptional regulator [Actinomadura namibiensis]MBA8951984.1 DNA-binding GntR family transcriptional regulator [Actinomadura namibiensis]
MTQPAYQRIADDLRKQIIDGHLAPGDRIPSRPQLRETYGVSDAVAIQAVRLLVSEGYVQARSGSGTYVREHPKVRRLTRSWYREARGRASSPFRADMEAQGRAGAWRSPSETTTATPAVAERLGITEGDPVMQTKYTFLADDQPVMLSTSWEPLEITRGTPVMLPEQGPHAGAGVVARMRAIGREVELATEVVTARSIHAAEAELLDEPIGSIVMVIQRTYSGNRPVETADIVVPTDRYELAYVIPVE